MVEEPLGLSDLAHPALRAQVEDRAPRAGQGLAGAGRLAPRARPSKVPALLESPAKASWGERKPLLPRGPLQDHLDRARVEVELLPVDPADPLADGVPVGVLVAATGLPRLARWLALPGQSPAPSQRVLSGDLPVGTGDVSATARQG